MQLAINIQNRVSRRLLGHCLFPEQPDVDNDNNDNNGNDNNDNNDTIKTITIKKQENVEMLSVAFLSQHLLNGSIVSVTVSVVIVVVVVVTVIVVGISIVTVIVYGCCFAAA